MNRSGAVSSSSANATSWFQQKITALRQRDNFVGGVMTTGLVGLTAFTTWLGYLYDRERFSAILPVGSSLATATLSRFYGGSITGAVEVFTKHFPKALELTRSTLKSAPKHGETGVWLGKGIDVRWSQFFSKSLATAISNFLKNRDITTVWDFGCGQGDYVKKWRKDGINTCDGLDGNPATVALTGGVGGLQDLAVPFKKEQRECVVSLEVGAKIPREYEDQFLQNIADHASDLVILSWPVEGQPGPNQINRRNNDYIIAKMEALGLKFNKVSTEELRREGFDPVCYWFQDTLLVFEKGKKE